MLLSSCAEKAIGWLHEAERPGGGIAGAHDGKEWLAVYPEVTGYLIPTLLAWGCDDLAQRCGAWLASVQNDDGSFNSWHGGPAVFDTAMVLQGLDALAMKDEASLARSWLGHQGLEHAPAQAHERDYLVKAVSMWDNTPGFDWLDRYAGCIWPFAQPGRIHYIAYAVEGLKRMGYETTGFLMSLVALPRPFSWSYMHDGQVAEMGYCAAGNCQMALLLGDRGLLEVCAGWQLDNGGLPRRMGLPGTIAWAVKYFLDAIKELGDG